MPTITDPAILATTIEEADNVILRWGHGSMRQLPAAETEMVVAALRATTPPEAQRKGVFVPDDIYAGALAYILHVGANHTMRGEPHPQQWIVTGLLDAASVHSPLRQKT